jgi:hypothetical protein
MKIEKYYLGVIAGMVLIVIYKLLAIVEGVTAVVFLGDVLGEIGLR